MAPVATSGVPAEERLVVKSPLAGAVAGLLFAILFSTSVVILKLSVEDVSRDQGQWLRESADWVTFAIGLMPFAGIFFLWFIGVARARLGRFQDQFFSTVFLGSGLIFLAMVFAASAVAATIVTGYARDPVGFPGSSTYYLCRDVITQIFGIYALRMAAVFLLSQATLWLRTKVMPRWMTFITYPLALLLLLTFTQSFWVVLVFPGWVLLVSSYILVVGIARRRSAGADAAVTESVDEAEA